MIIALAGRRVDSADAKESRFPLRNVERVRTRARAVLKEKGATTLVSSAACGADLIAVSEAGQLGLRRRVILPFGRSRFQESSVTDRPGEWGRFSARLLTRWKRRAISSFSRQHRTTNRIRWRARSNGRIWRRSPQARAGHDGSPEHLKKVAGSDTSEMLGGLATDLALGPVTSVNSEKGCCCQTIIEKSSSADLKT